MRVTILSTTNKAQILAGSVDATSDHLTGEAKISSPASHPRIAAPEDGRSPADFYA